MGIFKSGIILVLILILTQGAKFYVTHKDRYKEYKINNLLKCLTFITNTYIRKQSIIFTQEQIDQVGKFWKNVL